MQTNPLSILNITVLQQVQRASTPTQLDPLYHVFPVTMQPAKKRPTALSQEKTFHFPLTGHTKIFSVQREFFLVYNNMILKNNTK